MVEILKLDTSAGLAKLEEMLRTRQGFRISTSNIATNSFTFVYLYLHTERREILKSNLFVMFNDIKGLKVK